MKPQSLVDLEKQIARLSEAEQLLLIERLVHRLRRRPDRKKVHEAHLAEMAADPEIQREIARINAEFRCTEADGLESL